MSITLPKMCVAINSAVLGIMLLAAVRARADDSGPSMILLSGFGTFGEVHSSEHQADFTGSIFKPNGAGFSHNWSSDVDSLIAGQVVANVTPHLSAIVQVISEQNYDNTYRPHVEWADIKYQFTPEFSLRAGRTVLQSFLQSDVRNVGYAYPWVRPPQEVYGSVPITSSDGVDASYRIQTAGITQTLVGSYGRSSLELPTGTADTNGLWLIADTIEYGPATLHLAYQQARMTLASLGGLFDAFRQFGAQGDALANEYDPHKKLVKFAGVGASYDPGQWFVMGEWGTSDFHSALGNYTVWYASGGYRLAKFTPYLTYGQARSDNLSDHGLTVSTLPAYLAGAATALNAGLNSILSAKVAQNTTSLGGRWDFTQNIDLKLQFDHTRLDAGSSGNLTDLRPGFQLGSRVYVISATLDFVF